MKIGAFGTSLIFRISDNQMLTFRNMKREVTWSWGIMERIGEKPLPYFQGPNLQTITMEIILDATLGIRPAKLLEMIEGLVESGQAEFLVIGRRKIGKNRWVITKSSEARNTILSGGELLKATANLTLQEYY